MPIVSEHQKEQHKIVPFSFTDLENLDGGTAFQPFLKNVAIQENSTQINGTELQHPLFPQQDVAPITTQVPNQSTSAPIQTNIGLDDESIRKRDELIEVLIQKSDTLSGEIANLQAKLDNQDRIFQNELQNIKKDAYESGVRDGIQRAEQNLENQYQNNIGRLGSSIKKLEKLSNEFESMSSMLEKELINTSIAIAKEVITNEISFNSGQVAISLSKTLLQDISDATEIKLHVNGGDFSDVKGALSSLEKVEVISDTAISRGGVILISDVGTIEGNVMERFKKAKDSILSKID
jgi:flagellar assembly protein FliH